MVVKLLIGGWIVGVFNYFSIVYRQTFDLVIEKIKGNKRFGSAQFGKNVWLKPLTTP